MTDLAVIPLPALYERLRASPEGLTSDEARRRLAEVGPNEPVGPRRGAALVELLGVLANPLVVILLIASLVSAALGDPVNATIIMGMVLLSVALNVLQSYRSQRAAARLREEVTPTATARRDGAWVEVPRRSLVPGDLIRLAAGDRVPADARLLETRDLHVQQAALTGEPMPVEKAASAAPSPTRHLADAQNLVFLGTSVVSGTGLALVVATGPATAFGDIAARLSSRPPETEFERGIRHFPLPPSYFGFLAVATGTYLVFVELVKRRLLGRLIG